MARTSQQPGKTQTLNFFNIDEQLIFVDVPGYGYAKVSKAQRKIRKNDRRVFNSTRKSKTCHTTR